VQFVIPIQLIIIHNKKKRTFAAIIYRLMKSRLIFAFILLMTVAGSQAQDLMRPDSSRFRWMMKPPSINEMLKPSSFDVLRNMDGFPKIPLSSFDTFPATWSQFKCTFLDLPLPEEFALVERFYRNMEDGKKYQNNSIWYDPEENTRMKPRLVSSGGLSASLIQTLYDEYSHEGKMRRKYDSLVQQEEFERQIYPKYNLALVKQITGFTSDSAAYSFMHFCDFKNDSLLQANNYDIYWMIQNCLSQFLKRE